MASKPQSKNQQNFKKSTPQSQVSKQSLKDELHNLGDSAVDSSSEPIVHIVKPKGPPSKEHLYIWLDILGFSEEVMRDVDSGGALPKILKDFQKKFIIEIRNEIFMEVHTENGIEFQNRLKDGRMISDGIILDLGPVSWTTEMQLKDIFEKIGEKQFNFMKQTERLIRGGIALGMTFEDVANFETTSIDRPITETTDTYQSIIGTTKWQGEQIRKSQEESKHPVHYISSGLVRAYGTESRDIHWPIIGTTGEQIKKIRKLQEKLKHPNYRNPFGLKTTFNKKGEKIYFINFLSNATNNLDEFKLNLQEMIKINCKDKNMRTKVIDKYAWLCRYYNRLFHPHASHEKCLPQIFDVF